MDKISPEKRSENMRKIRSTNTKPELLIRKLIFSKGYRYRIHWKKLPGKPDLVFPGKKKVIFVHGCYWHQHSDQNCKITHKPKSKENYWNSKFEKNINRDIRNQQQINEMGWNYFVIWECQVKAYIDDPQPILEFLEDNV
jgi:DNA mismatch endonuclease (patch repair protein)